MLSFYDASRHTVQCEVPEDVLQPVPNYILVTALSPLQNCGSVADNGRGPGLCSTLVQHSTSYVDSFYGHPEWFTPGFVAETKPEPGSTSPTGRVEQPLLVIADEAAGKLPGMFEQNSKVLYLGADGSWREGARSGSTQLSRLTLEKAGLFTFFYIVSFAVIVCE